MAVALAASIRPRQLIVFTHSLSESELHATVNLHPGRVVVGAAAHIAVLADTVGHGPQGIVVQVGGGVTAGFRSDTTAFDGAIDSILGRRSLALLGLHGDVQPGEDGFAGCLAAVADMVLEMSRIARHHEIVLTRLGLGGACLVPTVGLPQLIEQIDEAVGDACARLRFPRPRVDIAPGPALVA